MLWAKRENVEEVMATLSNILQLDQEHVFHPWRAQGERNSTVVTGGKGSYFIDNCGLYHLDFHSGWGHFLLGYQPPEIINAIVEQVKKLCNVTPDYASEPAALLGRVLSEITPGDLSKCYFTTGGTDGIETAVKMARSFTGRSKIISRYRSYHGNTYGAGTISGDPRRLALEPAVTGIVRALDHYCYRCSFSLTYPSCGVHCADHIDELIELEGPHNIAAVLVEPLVASNGGLVPPPEYWPKLRAICDRHNILLISDEVVSGMGRTGTWFGCDQYGVVPDLLVTAKGLTAGMMPLGAAIVRPEIAEFFETRFLDAGLTYQSHPVACAAALGTIEYIRSRNLIEAAKAKGNYLMSKLLELQKRHPSVGDVRGLGLYVTVELVSNRKTREPLVPWSSTVFSGPGTSEVRRRLLEKRVKVGWRWGRFTVAPPLTISESEIDEGIAAIDYALCAADELTTE